MKSQSASGLLQFLQSVPDPRGREGQRHPHVAMLATIVCATLCGFTGYRGAAQWIKLQPLEFWHALGGKRKPPCENTFRYLLLKLDAKALEHALMTWITEGLGLVIGEDELAAVVLDGKALRGTRTQFQQAMMVVAALDLKTGCVFSEAAVDCSTNEQKTGLAMIKELVLEGRVVLGDAGYCDREVCEAVVDGGADYLVMVKDNQPNLHKAAQQSFVIPKDFSPLRSAAG